MKKLLSILLASVMLVSVFAVPAGAFVPTREVSYSAGFSYLQDFSGNGTLTGFTTPYAPQNENRGSAEVVDGELAYTVDTGNYSLVLVSDVAESVKNADSFTVEFDVSFGVDVPAFAYPGGGYGIYFGSANNDDPWVVEFYPSGLAANTKRTYKFTVNTAADTSSDVKPLCPEGSAFKKDAGETTWTTLKNHASYVPPSGAAHYRCVKKNYSGTAGQYNTYALSDSNDFTLGMAVPSIATSPFAGADPKIKLDNIKIYKEGSVEIGANYGTIVGVDYTNDFEGTFSKGSGYSVNGLSQYYNQTPQVVKSTENNGNSYYSYQATPGSYYDAIEVTMNQDIQANSVITFDLRCDAEGVPFIVAAKNTTLDAGFGIAIFGDADGQWYTYKILVGEKGNTGHFNTTVYRKLRGAADATYGRLNGTYGTSGALSNFEGYDYTLGAQWAGSAKTLYLGYRFNVFSPTDADKNSKYSIDNFQMRDSLAYSGSYTATDAELFVESNEATEVVIMASYENDTLKDVKFTELDGSNNKVDLSVTAGAETKIFIWNKLAGGKPILANPIEIQ